MKVTFNPIRNVHLMAGATHNGWEDSPGSVISSEAGLAHAGTIVHNQGGNILITHGALVELR